MCLPVGICDAACNRAVVLLVAALVIGSVWLRPCSAQPSISGEYEYYAAVGLNRTLDPYAIRNRLRIRGRFAQSRFMVYSAVRLSDALSDPNKGGNPGPLRIRLLEAFLDLYFDRVDVRIGHQLVVWGQMDGVFITDVVSPLDLTEFLAQDFTDIRLAVPAVKASYFSGSFALTGLLVATPLKSPIPPRRSPWFVIPAAASAFDIRVEPDNLPEPGFETIEPGLKASYNGLKTTVDLIYLYGFNRIPILAKVIDIASEGGPAVTLHPDYYRRHVVGSRVSSTLLDPLVLDAEFAYESKIEVDVDPTLVMERPAAIEDAPGLLLNEGHLMGGLAVSRTYRNTFIRGQVLGSFLTRYDDRSARDRFDEAITLLLRSAWRSETFVGSLFAYYNPAGDYWLNPMLHYNGSHGVNLFLGAHVFGGDATTGSLTTAAFGLFDANDFVYVRATLAF